MWEENYSDVVDEFLEENEEEARNDDDDAAMLVYSLMRNEE